MGEVGLDASRGPGAGSAHVVAVMTVVVMVVVVVMVQVRRLGCSAPVRPLFLLEIPYPLIVTLQLVTEESVFLGCPLLVVLQATNAVQPLQVDPTAPQHAHAVHYEMRPQVYLQSE